MAYLIIHTGVPFLVAIFATIYYLILRKWAKREPIEEDAD